MSLFNFSREEKFEGKYETEIYNISMPGIYSIGPEKSVLFKSQATKIV